MNALSVLVAPYLATIKYIVYTALVVAFLSFHYYDKQKAVTKVRNEYALQLQQAHTAKETAEKELNEQHYQTTKIKDKKIALLELDLSSSIDSLRKRPSRMPSTKTAEAGSTCTGKELFREDAELLTREAHRADKVIEERNYYYQEYENARLKLEEYGNR